MSMTIISLVRCENYNLRGFTYSKGKQYLVSEKKAEELLGKEDEVGIPYFKAVKEETPQELKAKEARAEKKARKEAKKRAPIKVPEESNVEINTKVIEDVEEIKELDNTETPQHKGGVKI